MQDFCKFYYDLQSADITSSFDSPFPFACVSRADAQAGVRKQGCKSLTHAYCMVGSPGSLQPFKYKISIYLFFKTNCCVFGFRSSHGIIASSCSGALMTLFFILRSPQRQIRWQQEK